jgi:hypothetical protein
MARRFSSLNRRVPESGEGLSLRRLPSGEGSTSSAAVAFDRIDFEGGEAQLRVEVSARPSSPAMHLPAIFESPVC